LFRRIRYLKKQDIAGEEAFPASRTGSPFKDRTITIHAFLRGPADMAETRHSHSESRPQVHSPTSWAAPSADFKTPTEVQEWHRDSFLVTTDRSLISLPALAAAFSTKAMYWTSAYPDSVMRAIIDNSCCFSLLSPEGQIGFARAVTDYVTFFYLTDVYVDEKWQGQGLGSWMIECVQEFVESMPYLRRSLLLTSKGPGEAFYKKTMKMGPLQDPLRALSWRGPGGMV
jgi:GNAT superfamily N-acetyltransferase